MRILVTGAAGFIGFHLVRRLVNGKDEIYGLDNINDYYDVNLKLSRLEESGIRKNLIEYRKLVQSHKYPNYCFIKLDLTDRPLLNDFFQNHGIDLVINLAAQAGVRYSLINPTAYIDSNINGFFNLLDCCRNFGVKQFFYASSSSVYGNNPKSPVAVGDCTDHPLSLYAASKKSNELMAYSYSHLFKIQTTGLRFFTVYGPWGRPDMALYIFTKAILDDEPIDLYNYGNMERDFTFINDVIESLSRLISFRLTNLEGEISGTNGDIDDYKIYNIGNSSPVKITSFVRALERVLDRKAVLHYLPMQPGDVSTTFADVGDLVNAVHYKPNTDINEGVKQFVNWYRVFYKV